MKKIEHIGIAVKNLESANALYKNILGETKYKTESVEDIRAEMKRMKEAGFTLTRDEPFRGADNKLVCFVHPKSTNGVLVELCQEIK